MRQAQLLSLTSMPQQMLSPALSETVSFSPFQNDGLLLKEIKRKKNLNYNNITLDILLYYFAIIMENPLRKYIKKTCCILLF